MFHFSPARRAAHLSIIMLAVAASASNALANGPELVVNGNFSAGNTGFTTSYTYNSSSVFFDGNYGISTNPHILHSGGASYGDHTTGTGNMMVINATPNGVTAWQETVAVTPGTTYDLIAWASEWGNPPTGSNPATLLFTINGVSVGSILNVPMPDGIWGKFENTWLANSSTAVIRIVDTNNSNLDGNDFALDDISFTALGPPQPFHFVAASGNWTLAANWSTSVVPGAADAAFVDGGGTAQITTPVTIGTLSIGPGTIQVSSTLNTPAIIGNGAIALNGGSVSVGASDASFTFGGTLSGTGTFVKAGTGSLTLTTASPAFTGTLQIVTGSVILGVAQAIPASASLSVNGTLNSTVGPLALNSLFGSGTILMGANTLTLGGTSNSVFSGNISGTGAFIKTGVGTVVLNGTNTFPLGATINGGVIVLGNNAALGTAPITINNAAIAAGNGARTLSNTTTLIGTTTFTGQFDLTFSTSAARTLAAGSVYLHTSTGTTTLNGSFTGMAGSGITVSAGTLILGDPASFTGFTDAGNILVNAGGTLVMRSAAFVTAPGFTLNGGTLTSSNGIALNAGQYLTGFGTVGKLAQQAGSIVNTSGNLAIGDSNSVSGVFSDGELYVNHFTVTLLDQNQAVLGSLTQLGDATGPGNLAGANGILLSEGKNLVGFGTVSGPFVTQGAVQGIGNSPTDELRFISLVSGRGSFTGTVAFAGGYSPGNSPAAVILENAIYENSDTLTMELGGLIQGDQYDHLTFTGAGSFDGALNVVLINGFSPAIGESFDLIDGITVGHFSSITLPPVPGGYWDTSALYTTGVIAAVPEPASLGLLFLGASALLVKRHRARTV